MSLQQIVNFVRENTAIGVVEVPRIVDGMWDGCKIYEGQIVISTTNPPHLGNLLHEIGHIASTPPAIRSLMSSHEELDYDFGEDFLQAAIEYQRPLVVKGWSDDDAATYWAAMAAIEIGLCSSLPFQQGYEQRAISWGMPGHKGFDRWQAFLINGCRFRKAAYHLGLAPANQNTMLRWEVADLDLAQSDSN